MGVVQQDTKGIVYVMNFKVVITSILLIVPMSVTSDHVPDIPVPSKELLDSLKTEDEGSSLERHFGSSISQSTYRLVYDVDCEYYESGRYKTGRWIKVEKEDCPIVFEDPYFEKHAYICNRESDELALHCDSELQTIWSYPEYQECKSVPVCFACPVLAQCGARTPLPPTIGGGFGIVARLTEVEYYRYEQLQLKHWLNEQDKAELACLQEKQRGLRPSWNSCIQGSLRESGTGGLTNIHVNVVQGSSHQSTGNQHLSSHGQSGVSHTGSGQTSSFEHFSSNRGSSRTSQVSGQSNSFNHQGTTSQFGHDGFSQGSNSHLSSGHDGSHTSRQVSGQSSRFNQEGISSQFGHGSFSHGANSGHGSFQHSSNTHSFGQNSGFNQGSRTRIEGHDNSLSHDSRTQILGQGSSFSRGTNSQLSGQNSEPSHGSSTHLSGQGSFSHSTGTQAQVSGLGSFSQQLRSDQGQGFSHSTGTQAQVSVLGSFSQQSRTDQGQGFSHSTGTQAQVLGQGSFSHQSSTDLEEGFSHSTGTQAQVSGQGSFSHNENTQVSSSSWGTPSNNWGMGIN